MDELVELYYNPKLGLTSPYKLYIKLKKCIPLKTIEEFIKKQESYQIKLQRNRPKSFKPMVVYSVNDQWQIDLCDFSKYSHWNSGYKYLLCAVDVFSRKAFVSALKRKSDTTEAISKIFVNDKPVLIQSDNGTEFLNNKKAFQKGFEPTFGKTIYQIYKGDGYSFKLQNDMGVKLNRNYKVYELLKVPTSDKFNYNHPVRENPLTQQERRNKRELDDLLEHTVEPLHKKRKIFTGKSIKWD
jgi:hypothetical protein